MSQRAPTSVVPNEPLPFDEARLVHLAARGSEVIRSLSSDPLVIGSSARADLRLSDRSVSARHAQVWLSEEGVVVQDMGSENGTSVNGARVDKAIVTSDSLIACGNSVVRIELGPPQALPTSFGDALSRAPAMHHIFGVLQRLAATEIPVLLIGETGTGKDVLARAVHQQSQRAKGNFAIFDCASVAANLVESELFGHERGAFTGAVAEYAGVFERGIGGTVFLDEIGELPLDLQPRLLRVLESQQLRRVGGTREIPIDGRIVAATNRDLESEVAAGRFREDLYFRLSTAVVQIPPLRKRREDIPLLAQSFLEAHGAHLQLDRDAQQCLEDHDWPGNVRQLKNVVTRAAAMAEGPQVSADDLNLPKTSRGESTLKRLPLGGRALEDIEKAAIEQTLRKTKGNKSKAAKLLGIAASTLYEKIRRYGL